MSNQNICNTCGANYEYKAGRWKCPACGAYKPDELSPEERTLIDTAERYLRTQHYVEAEEAFEDIIRKYPKNHEGYWGYVRARYGIKYEEDYDGKRIPTCTATSIESFTDDPDFLKAVALADRDTAEWYRSQAMYIERVRKIWIEKANKEAPYDIFICYKDSDRTIGVDQTNDSIEAAMLYAHLQAKGYRVFFSRESLRDKVGEKYEPYIFNALSTAKIMIVYSSSAEYIRATWLKNEWHRYIKKIEKGEKKENSLIVAYDGFSPSELPTVLASKQCIDASKHNRNFYHDLDAYVDKIVNSYFNAAQPVSTPKPIPMVSALHEHKYKSEIIKGSCLSKGYTIYRCECGEEYRDNFTPLQEHTFKKTKTQEPTCTETGYEEYTCSVCGDKDKRPIAAKGHSFGGWIEKKRPTCTEKGEHVRQCSVCGARESKSLDPTGHKWSTPVEHKDESGRSKSVSICSLCGEEKELPSKLHKENYFSVILRYTIGVILILSSVCILVYFLVRAFDGEDAFIGYIIGSLFFGGMPMFYILKSLFVIEKRSDRQKISYKTEYKKSGIYHFVADMKKAKGFVTIPEKFKSDIVYGIGENACKGNNKIECVALSNRIEYIGSNAFSDCNNLKAVELSEESILNTIGSGAFSNCRQLESINLPDGLTCIGGGAFNNCSNLKEIKIPETVTDVEHGAFNECNKIIEKENGILYVDNWVVGFDDSQPEVFIRWGTVGIAMMAFYESKTLKKVYMPDSVKYIGYGAFEKCYNLTEVQMSKKIKKIDSAAFRGCYELVSIEIPSGVTNLEYETFKNCSKLTTVILPNTLEKIGQMAFKDCYSLSRIILPNSLLTIGYCAFSDCSSLTSITIPKSVKELDETAFSSCHNLTFY